VTAIRATIGAENVYTGDERTGATLKRAHAHAVDCVNAQRRADSTGES
jgi:hypothetical protein